ncbi:MAG: hemerythrin, partial [Deltaproteobacteria bacterium]|nr:hemerythrin [Deltaproteobacteria bacterium]
HRYPAKAEHLKEHADFVETFSALAVQLRQGGPSSVLALEVNNKICQWLIRHVLGTDKPMCEHLRLAGLR